MEKLKDTDTKQNRFPIKVKVIIMQESLSLDIQFFDVETLIFRKVMQRLMFAPELFLHTLVIVNKDI